jgi:3-methyladenine DNA glycosylase/8-oxoguanine DNA glycosylase
MLTRLDSISGLGDDPTEFETTDPVVSRLHQRHPGDRFGRTDLVFDALIVAICGQKVTGGEAAAAMRGLNRKFSDSAPGPNPRLRLPPDPERIAETPYWEFHELHLEKQRADILRRVSADHERIDLLSGVATEVATTTLQSLQGIGRWSAAKTLEVSHGDPDQVAVGDFHFKHIVVHHMTGRARGTDEEMLELLEPFRPHRGRVIRLLHHLGHEPKFGPGVRRRDITRM